MIRSLVLSGAIAVAAVALAVPIARAEPLRLSGAATGSYLAHEGGGGAGLVLDLGAAFGAVRVGGFTGVAALLGQESNTRVFLPLGPAIAVRLGAGAVNASLGLRAGIWGGATDAGLAAGGLFGAGARFGYRLGRGASVTVGVDGWLMVGQGARWVIAPGVGLQWWPEPDDSLGEAAR